jgi:uncharacterized protein YecT (DUF1311 family)
MLFEYDSRKVPDVNLEREWQMQDGSINQVYRAGNWSFETSEEASMKYAQEAIYAWIAWHDFLASGGYFDQLKEQGDSEEASG